MVPLAPGRRRPIARIAIAIAGIVQGVGFRPFVFRLAADLGLTGWIGNSPAGVIIEAQSTAERLGHFLRRLQAEAPPLSVITSITRTQLPDRDEETCFKILESTSNGSVTAQIPPDTALCDDCRHELHDPADRRFRHPFITCTNCGPRYSIITAIPYDRPSTTMAGFPLCGNCRKEYDDPADRRFHAQPLCCPQCGPRLELQNNDGRPLATGEEALDQARRMLSEGLILAVKGIGGYHLAADAANFHAVGLLRRRKQRDEKPFAVMAADIAAARRLAELDPLEERLLASPEAPIVIVRRRPDSGLADGIAPNNAWLGLMLPHTPIHHLLFSEPPDTAVADCLADPVGGGKPATFTALVMTSGNTSDEPIAFHDEDARKRLGAIADAFLIHNRPIQIRQDDSVIRVFQGAPLFYRRARGYAPRAVPLPFHVPPLLATGAELKSAVCLADLDRAILSQHIGDLQNDATSDSYHQAIDHLGELFRIQPELVACDNHPDYLSSVFAEQYAAANALTLVKVQHHHAHLAACLADNRLTGDVIGLIFDGTGYGDDGTVWGGEFLIGSYDRFCRAAHFRQVLLPGGDAAVREPWRMALALLFCSLGQAAFDLDLPAARKLSTEQRPLFSAMLERGLNSPLTSSCGRLFDAAAALIGLRQNVSYDGQAAIELEALAESGSDNTPYPFITNTDVDLTPAFPAMLGDLQAGILPSTVALRFHCTVAEASIETCCRIAAESGLTRVLLSGGVFQNRLLTDLLYTGLTKRGLEVFTHRLTPPNDGCIALGQTAIAGWTSRRNC